MKTFHHIILLCPLVLVTNFPLKNITSVFVFAKYRVYKG